MCFGHDPLAEHADPAALTRILDKLELLVCATPFWSQTAWHADIVLPVSSYLEQESILFQQNGLKARLCGPVSLREPPAGQPLGLENDYRAFQAPGDCRVVF